MTVSHLYKTLLNFERDNRITYSIKTIKLKNRKERKRSIITLKDFCAFIPSENLTLVQLHWRFYTLHKQHCPNNAGSLDDGKLNADLQL